MIGWNRKIIGTTTRVQGCKGFFLHPQKFEPVSDFSFIVNDL